RDGGHGCGHVPAHGGPSGRRARAGRREGRARDAAGARAACGDRATAADAAVGCARRRFDHRYRGGRVREPRTGVGAGAAPGQRGAQGPRGAAPRRRAGENGCVADARAGAARVRVVLGRRAGPMVVTARVGGITQTAAVSVDPGPPSELVVLRDSMVVKGPLGLESRDPVALRVLARDAYGNETPLTGFAA